VSPEAAEKVLREQTIPMLRASGGGGHADAIEETLRWWHEQGALWVSEHAELERLRKIVGELLGARP
jgi:hypothetical protein